ncbi:MAG: insulinase family protein [Betaproteobacteria bacterium]|nr:insulinase family protein [Betaproteobacteria bacterium]
MFRSAFLLAVSLLLLAFAPAGAAQAPQRIAEVEGVTEYRLENGLRVLLVPDATIDKVTVHITYLVGSRHEGYGEKGMAHLLEHMLFKGSPRFPEVKQELVRRGARWNGSTSYDRTNYFETLSAGEDNLDWALSVEADRMVNARIRKQDLDSEMTVVRNEFESGENSPGSVLSQRMSALAFQWHNYGNAIIGARSDIENVPIERLQAFYRTWYQPDNAVLIVAGKYDEQSALAMVLKHFGAVPRPSRTLPQFYTEEPVQDGERSVVLRRSGDTQLVSAMYRVPSGGHPDYPAVDVLTHVLGSVPSGRLHRALVQSGKASRIWGYERSSYDPGSAVFGAALAKDAPLEPARDALLAELESIAAQPITAAEVERARTELLNDFEKTQLDSRALVSALSEYSAMGDWRLFFLYRDRLRALSVADVQRAAQAWLRPANRVLGSFVPTQHPERAQIPPRSDVAKATEHYRGAERIFAGESFDASPQAIEARVIRRTLPNGIRLAMLPKKSRGAQVQLSLALHWGDEQSTHGRYAACSYAGALLMRGTSQRSREELHDAFEKLRATPSVGSGGASLEVQRENLDSALRLVAEALRQPAFPAAEFEQMKRSSLTSIEAERSDPAAIADENLGRHLSPYPKGHWNETQTLEERLSESRAVTVDQARRCYQDFLGASGANIAAVGDFDPEAFARIIEELFGDWKNPAPYTRIRKRYFDRPAAEREFLTPDKANAVLRAGVSIPMRDDHPDYPAMVLGSYLLGGSSSARLPSRIREKEGLSYSTYAWFRADSLDEVARFGASAIFAPANKARVESALREELRRARAEGFTAEEVESGKRGFLEARRLARTQDRALAARLESYLHIDRTLAWDVEFESRVAALAPEQLRDALRRNLDLNKLSVMTAGDFK